jgi:hypothetical protein
MPETDRESRILELKRLVQTGEYKIEPLEVAANLIRESEFLAPYSAEKQSSPESTPETELGKSASTVTSL